MQRHEALRPLSRRHQGVLLRARDLYWRSERLKAGRAAASSTALAELLEFADADLPAHFEAERDVLGRVLRENGVAVDLLETMLRQQDEVTAAIDELRRVGDEDSAALERTCAALREHVRLCEHELYPAAEKALDEDTLQQIHRRLGAFKV